MIPRVGGLSLSGLRPRCCLWYDGGMGTFIHRMTLLSADASSREELDALVDTGATFSSAPPEVLERLGMRREARVRLRLASGQVMERSLGFVRVELLEERRIIPITFADQGEPAVIGAITLETFLLAVDPVAQRLVPVEGLMV